MGSSDSWDSAATVLPLGNKYKDTSLYTQWGDYAFGWAPRVTHLTEISVGADENQRIGSSVNPFVIDIDYKCICAGYLRPVVFSWWPRASQTFTCVIVVDCQSNGLVLTEPEIFENVGPPTGPDLHTQHQMWQKKIRFEDRNRFKVIGRFDVDVNSGNNRQYVDPNTNEGQTGSVCETIAVGNRRFGFVPELTKYGVGSNVPRSCAIYVIWGVNSCYYDNNDASQLQFNARVFYHDE